MIKHPFTLLLSALLITSEMAYSRDVGLPPLPPETVNDYGNLPDVYLGEKNPTLLPLEKQALAIGNQWRNPGKQERIAPSLGQQGFIRFLGGTQTSKISLFSFFEKS